MADKQTKALDPPLETLILFWDGQVKKLLDAGLHSGHVATSLWAAAARAETLHENLEADAKGKLDEPDDASPEKAGDSAERRGPGRPWAKRAGQD